MGLISTIERLHRTFLELVQIELTGHKIDDISSVQAMIMLNIGDLELTVGEIKTSGCYLGSNVSYNIKKMVESGYLDYTRSTADRRVVRVRLSEKAKKLRTILQSLHDEHVAALTRASVKPEAIERTMLELQKLEEVWQGLARRSFEKRLDPV